VTFAGVEKVLGLEVTVRDVHVVNMLDGDADLPNDPRRL